MFCKVADDTALALNIEIIQMYVLKQFVLMSRDNKCRSLCSAVIINIILRSWSCGECTQLWKFKLTHKI